MEITGSGSYPNRKIAMWDKVGIQTTNPQATLEVNGSGIIRGTLEATGNMTCPSLTTNGNALITGNVTSYSAFKITIPSYNSTAITNPVVNYGMAIGTNDNATYANFNIGIFSWWSIGFCCGIPNYRTEAPILMDVRDGHLSCKGNIVCQSLTTNGNTIINGTTTTQSLVTTANSFIKADGTQSIYFLEGGGSSTTSNNRIGHLFGTTASMYFDFNDSISFRYYTNKDDGTNMNSTLFLLNSNGASVNGSVTATSYKATSFLGFDNSTYNNTAITSPTVANGIAKGTGDGATYSLFNTAIYSWHGIGFCCGIGNSYNNTTEASIFMDTRTGSLSCKGSVTATSYNSTSDYRIKDNVIVLKETGYTIDGLRPVKYFNKQSQKDDIGIIAHELQEKYPCLVNGEKDGEEMQTVNYIGLIPILIKEIQDLKSLLRKHNILLD